MCANFIVKTDTAREVLSEFIGTFMLVLVNIAGPLNLQLSGVSDVLLCNLTAAAGVFLGMVTAMSNSGAHLNPIVTTSFAARGAFPWKKAPYFIAAQYLGAFVAAFVAFVNFSDGISALDGGVRVFVGSVNATGTAFASAPNPNASFMSCVFDTMLCSTLLLFAICAITDRFNSGVPVYLYAPCVSFAVLGIVSAFSFNCGVAMNPARDLGPRVFTLLAGYGTQGFAAHRGAFWLVATLVPHLGGLLGCQLYWLSVGLQKPGERERIDDLALTDATLLKKSGAKGGATANNTEMGNIHKTGRSDSQNNNQH